jgi:tRNA threonylcarbamoyladenosine biosynthesis protein TsaB
MIVLAIDTCGAAGSVALGNFEDNAVTILGQSDMPGKTYSAQLMPAVRTLLAGQQPDAIVVVNGPGSFTGVRIGVSSAKGLAEALSIPLLAVSRLAVLAWKANVGAAALDAGRGEFYFRHKDQEILLPAGDTPNSGTVAICEPGALQIFSDAILVDPPTAADALQFAAPLLAARDFADIATLDGNYLRRSDAEIFAKAAGKR